VVRQVAIRRAIHQAKWMRHRMSPVAVDEPAVRDVLPDVDLARAIASLSPQQRAAVALFYLEDLPVDEVAHLLEVSTSTVKQHLHRARARLATLLSEVPEEVPGDVD
jgi:RNA polymerase sigma factor (sigma-70 family)